MSFEALTNHREYLSAHYLAEILPGSLKKGQLADWAAREKKHETTPRQSLRGLRQAYFAAKSDLIDIDDDVVRAASLRELHKKILDSLGFTGRVDGRHLAVVEAGWADDTDKAGDPDGAGRLLDPVDLEPRKRIETGYALASHLFTGDEPPRYVLILNGGVITLADRHTWSEGRYLAASLDVAFGRNDTRPGGELDIIAALFSAESLLPPDEGGDPKLATVVGESRQHAVGVSSELREGLRLSVELIANAVLTRIREQGVDPVTLMEPRELARELGRESLRYLYRVLFLLYAEARPELGVLPADDPDYVNGYSMQRLGELVSRKPGGEQARKSFHLYESLDLLFRMVNDGHHPRGAATIDEKASEDKGIRFEPLRSDLFLPEKTKHIGRQGFEHPDNEGWPVTKWIDTRLPNATLYQVLRLLMLTRGKRKERGGFISYAQLGINQLGAVYEGLMSYTGFIAAEELYEVAKGGDPKDGSWTIPSSKVDEYPDEVFVTRADEHTGARSRVRYPAGSFVYRLAGRDRQTSASYYTPQSLTEVTVQLALKYRLDQDGTVTPAREMLDWTICEPALGSGAFLNEAINQVAAEYLRRRQAELGTTIDPDQYAIELQKVKAYIALHNSYGVDLNATAVELAEVSLWLNVMHRGLQAPWFGLHLRRGNSLIGGRRQYYMPDQLAGKAWLTTAPTDHKLSSPDPWPDGAIHHFLALPAWMWVGGADPAAGVGGG